MTEFFRFLEPSAVPATMAPLDCMERLDLIELGFGTLGDTLRHRWSGAVRPDAVLSVRTDFWPSAGLLESLPPDGPFVLTGADDLLLAERRNAAEPVRLTVDAASLSLRYPWDLLRVNEEMLASFRVNDIRGTVRDGVTLDGILILGEGSVVLPGVYVEGVAVVGRNCKLGPNCYLRGNNFIGDGCHIGQAVEIKNSILMHKVSAGHLTYLGDSIVCPRTNFGGGTIASNFRHDGKNHRSMVGGALVDTGRRKFGTVIGMDVHTGIHTAIYPGRKLWAGVSTRPGDVVRYDLITTQE